MSFSILLRRVAQASGELWQRALDERSTPPQIGVAIAIGVFAGCTPFFGFHLGVAVVLATVLRANRLWAAVGSRVSFTPSFAVIAFCEIQSAHRLRTGFWLPLGVHAIAGRGKEMVVDWLIGSWLIGLPLAAAAGWVGYLVAGRWQRVMKPTPAAPPQRSSECPPSAPPASST